MIKFYSKITIVLIGASLITSNSNALNNKNHSIKNEIVQNNKKILILSSKGGAGHIFASKTLCSLLDKEYDVKIIYPTEALFTQFDFLRKIAKNYTWEEIHNKLFQNGYTKIVNSYVYIYTFGITPLLKKDQQKKFEKIFEQEKPNLIISIIPLFNRPAKNAADKFKIPYILIALDMDLSMWTIGLNKINKENFLMTIYDDFSKNHVKKDLKNIPAEKIKAIGIPTRPEFLTTRTDEEKKLIRKEWDIPNNKFTVLLMMGSTGSKTLVTYTQKLAESNLPIHVLVCIGRQAVLEKKLKTIISKANPKTTFKIIPFTYKVADLMSISNLFITKGGATSFNEARSMNLPVLFDNTQTNLFWEKGTLDFAEKKQVGESIKKFRYLKKTITKYLDKNYYQEKKNAFQKLQQINFNKEIEQIVHKMCPVNSSKIVETNSKTISLT